MDTLIIYPENEEQLTALKVVINTMKIAFEQKSESYPDFVISGVKESLKQAENNELTPYSGIKEMLNR